MAELEWTNEDDAAAAQEGWGLFETGGCDHAPIELQYLADAEEDGTQLDDDPAAWRIVFNDPTPLHEKAIAYLWENSPEEVAHILSHIANESTAA